ncbi:TetR/AcrR family transcriptional regulator C-terminal ligand-binding domain-containing protein [Cellulomonas sp. 179-A 4D5 NHS]|uniref:TetR/AcrR family transcriptional regulator n=1 Tax=Cellulomonas sp. 179-A 4D5 NHS TaxID=3142378 RepID=UPI0039A2E74A
MTRGQLDPRVARSREAVLAAALELLLERGIVGTTIEAVAERSGVAKTTIYRQWEGQPALVLDAFDSALRPPVDPETGSARGDLRVLLHGLADALSAGPAAILMSALIDAAERDPAYAALHKREAAQRHAVVRACIERGIARGELRPDSQPDTLIDLLAGPLFHRRLVSSGRVERRLGLLQGRLTPGEW